MQGAYLTDIRPQLRYRFDGMLGERVANARVGTSHGMNTAPSMLTILSYQFSATKRAGERQAEGE